MRKKFVLIILTLLLAVFAGSAAVRRVGNTWPSGSNPYPSLTKALEGVVEGDEVWVSAGIYREPGEIIIPSGVKVYGGFAGRESSLSERDYSLNLTILDGSGAHRVATVYGLLDGFTLRNGRTGDNGGGVLIKAGGTVDHCIAFANEAGYDGGGVFAEEGGTVKNTLISGNRAGNDGVAVSGRGGYKAVGITAVNNTFTDVPSVAPITVPSGLKAGDVLDLPAPAITDDHGSTVLVKGWELDGNAISMPYTLSYADNGKELTYWAANAVGVGYSNKVVLSVEWVASFREALRTPKAVCAGTTLSEAGIVHPEYSPAPVSGEVTYRYFFLSGNTVAEGDPGFDLTYPLSSSDNGKLLVCRIYKDGTYTGTQTPAVRVVVQDKPAVMLSALSTPLRAEAGRPLCLPEPYVVSGNADITARGWQLDGAAFTSCTPADPATMQGKTLRYVASNACGDATPVEYARVEVFTPAGEFSLTRPLCEGMRLGDGVAFNDGGQSGTYTLGGKAYSSWEECSKHILTAADDEKVLRFTYGSNSSRFLSLRVHPVPSLVLPVDPSEVSVCRGSECVLRVSATGEGLFYRWQRTAGAGGAGWTDVTGGTESTLRLNVSEDGVQYRCLVGGVCAGESGGEHLVSPVMKVNMTTLPVIAEELTLSSLHFCEGKELLVQLEGKEPSVTGRDVPGLTQEGWLLGGTKIGPGYQLSAADNGKPLGYQALNACGESVRNYSSQKVEVDRRLSLLQLPADVTVSEGGRVRLSVVTALPDECTYQWQKQDAATSVWSAVPAAADGSDKKAAYTFTTPSGDAVDAALLAGESYRDKYRCLIASANVCADAPEEAPEAVVTVMRTPTDILLTEEPSVPAGGICAGETHSLVVKASNRTARSYTWYRDGQPVNGAVSSDNTATSTLTTGEAGTYYCLVTSEDNSVGVRTHEVTLAVHPVPSVIRPLEADFAVCKGETVSLGFAVEGGGVSYQWYCTPQGGRETAVSGAAGNMLTGLRPDVTTTYTVKATVAYCGDKAAADLNLTPSVTVTVNDKPSLSGGPMDKVTYCEESSLTGLAAVSVEANGSALTQESWTLNGIDIKPEEYTVSTADEGKLLRYRAVNGCGETVVSFDNKAVLHVDRRPELLQSPVDVTAEEGTQVRLSVLTGNKDVTYAWYKTGSRDVLSSGPSYIYTPSELTGEDLAGSERRESYYCVVTAPAGSACRGKNGDVTAGASGLAWAQSETATVTVRRKTTDITVTEQPREAYAEACATDAAGTVSKVVFPGGIRITAEGRGELSFTWYKNGKPAASGSASAPGADGYTENSTVTSLPETGDRDPLSPTTRQSSVFHPTAAGTYFCLVRSTDNPAGVRSEACLLTVHPLAGITADLSGTTETLCEGSSLSLGIVATGAGRSYEWQWKANGAGDDAYVTLAGETDSRLRATVDGDKTYRCVVTASCADGITTTATTTLVSKTHTVTMSRRPEVRLDAAAEGVLKVCAGERVTLPGDSKLQIELHNGTLSEHYWTLGGLKFDAASYTAQAFDNGKTFGYSAANGCGVTSVPFNLTLEVHERPVILQQPQGTEAEMGSQVRLGVRAAVSYGTLSYRWEMKNAATGLWVEAVPSCTEDTYTFTAEAIEDVSVSSITTSYRCVVTLGGETACTYSEPSAVADVKVNRTRSSVSIVEQPAGYELCSSDAFLPLEIEVKGSGHFTYTWYRKAAPSPEQVRQVTKNKGSAGYTKDSFTPEGPGAYYCTVESSDGTGIRSQQAVVTRYAEPQGVDLVKEPGSRDYEYTVCSGKTVLLAVTAEGGDDLVYQWYKSLSAVPAGGTLCRGATSQTYTPLELVPGNNYYYCEVRSRRCAGKPAKVSPSAIVAQYETPVITTPPASKTVCEGTAAMLRVVASHVKAGGYRWFLNGTEQDGRTASFFEATDAGVYTCEVTSEHCGSVMSAPALVTVAAVPEVHLGDVQGLKACRGDLMTLPQPVVDARGAVVVTKKTGWFRTDDPSETLVSSCLVGGKQVYRYKLTYKCSAGDAAEKAWSGTSALMLTVDMTPMAEFTSGGLKDALTVNTGDKVRESDLVTAPLAVRGGTAEWLLGGTPVTFPYTVSAADDGKAFRVRVRNACGEEAYLTAAGEGRAGCVLTVNSLGITRQPVSQTYCEGETGRKLSVETGITQGVTYTWYKDGTAVIPAATGREYALSGSVSDAGVYTCEVRLGGFVLMSAPAVVTVNARPAVTAATEEITVCEGSPLTLQCDAGGTGLGYSWARSGSTAVLGVSSSLTLASAAAGSYVCTVTGSCSPAVTKTVTVTVNTAVRITTQPQSLTSCTLADLVVTATGTGSETAGNYTWYRDGVVTEVRSQTYPLAALNADAVDGKAHTYTCLVKGTCNEVMSAPAVVRKYAALSGGTVAVENGKTTVCPGESVTLTVRDVAGDNPQYVWRSGDPGTGDVIGNAATLTVSPVTATTYFCTVTNACTEKIEKSQAISVTAAPLFSVGELQAVTKKEGETVTPADIQTIAPASAGNTLSWTLGGTPVTFPYTVSAADNGRAFEVTATDGCGQRAVLPGSAALTVLSAPRLLEQPQGSTVCEGTGTITLRVKATGSGLAYQWLRDGEPVSDAAGSEGSDAVAGSGGAELTLTKPAAARSGVYTCRVSGTGGETVVSAPAVVTVNAGTAITSQPKAVTVWKGNAATLQVEATGQGLSYQWQKGDRMIAEATAASLTVTEAGNYCCIVTGRCGTETSNAVEVTVNTPVKITRQPEDQVYVCDYSTPLSVTATDATGYLWYKDGMALTSGYNDTYNAAALTVKEDGVYYCQVKGVAGDVFSASARVRKMTAVEGGTLIVESGKTTVCPGESVTLTVKDVTGDNPQYIWRSGDPGTGDVIGNAATLTVSPITTTTYFCTVSNSCSSQEAGEQRISVTAAPDKPVFTMETSGDICEGDEVTLPEVTNKAAAGRWELNGVPKGDITTYKVNAADDGQVFKYVNINACGEETVSDNTWTLKMKEPAQIISLLGSPILKEGQALNVKVKEPTSENAAIKKWELDYKEVTLNDEVMLADDRSRLTYTVDNGCMTGTGKGGAGEISAVLRVWKEPKIITNFIKELKLFCEGSQVILPAVTYEANNCVVTGEWSYGLNNRVVTESSTVTAAMDGQPLYFRLGWTAPDGTTGTTAWKQVGKFIVYKKPELTQLSAPKSGSAEVWYAGAKLTTRGVESNDGRLLTDIEYTLGDKKIDNPDGYTLEVKDKDKMYRITAINQCGKVSTEVKVSFPTDFFTDEEFKEGNSYFNGLPPGLVVVPTNGLNSVSCVVVSNSIKIGILDFVEETVRKSFLEVVAKKETKFPPEKGSLIISGWPYKINPNNDEPAVFLGHLGDKLNNYNKGKWIMYSGYEEVSGLRFTSSGTEIQQFITPDNFKQFLGWTVEANGIWYQFLLGLVRK